MRAETTERARRTHFYRGGGASRRTRLDRIAGLIALPGLLALVWEPLCWLVRTWTDPSYQSGGALVAAVVVALVGRSVLSGPASPEPRSRRWAWRLLIATAAIRLLGQLLAINTLGALALVVDVLAVGLLLGLARRPFALHPVALAAFSTLALPVEHLLQRLLGHPLQWVAAASVEQVLRPFFPALTRVGTLLQHPDIELAIDLPCSGARGLVLFTALGLALLCRRRAGVSGVLLGTLAAGGGALLANALRILGLFLGAHFSLPLIEEPLHTALGTATLVAGALPLLSLAARMPAREPARPRFVVSGADQLHAGSILSIGSIGRPIGSTRAGMPWPAALAISALGIAIACTPGHPLDVSPAGPGRPLPHSLGAFVGTPEPLGEQERLYFTRFGGGAEKMRYEDGAGPPHTALLVHTGSPLRHLHGPDRCLLGAGHDVTRLGVRPGGIPTIVYRSVAPDGRSWRVEASFVDDEGRAAASVSQVVWHWLERPDVAWNLVERISPYEVCEAAPERCVAFDRELFTALGLASND